jgi:hypothetical protein
MQSRRPLRGAYGECATYPKFAPYSLCACRKATDEFKVPLCRIHHLRPGRFELPLHNELWNQIFRCWRKRRSDSLTHLGACDGAFAPPPPIRGRLI